MPDWFYRTVSQPLLFSLPAPRARDLALGFHHAVGYLNFKHLLPAFGGFALMLVGLTLSYPFLCGKVVRE